MAKETRSVTVMGQGAVGTFLAARLARAGHDVHMVSSRAADTGKVKLHVGGRRPFDGTVTIGPHRAPEPCDLLVLAMRASDAPKRAWDVITHLAPGGALVPVQNGLVPLDIADELGEARVVPLVVGFNMRLEDPRTVQVTSPGGIVIGALDAAQRETVRFLARSLGGPVPARATRNARGAVWSKWCLSCAINGLAVVSGTGVGPITERREGREALIGVVTECVSLARASHVKLERVAGPLAPDRLAGRGSGGAGGALRHRLVRALGRRYAGVVPSSLLALREGRDLEIDALNARAVDMGARHGVATPWNRAVTDVASEIGHGKRSPGEDALGEVWNRANGR